MTPIKLEVAILSNGDDDLITYISLLSVRVRNNIEFSTYQTLAEFNQEREFDVIIVGDLDTLEGIVSLHTRRDTSAPLIVHIVVPESPVLNYAEIFPGARIHRIEQARLSNLDVTLKFDSFEDIIENLLHQQ